MIIMAVSTTDLRSDLPLLLQSTTTAYETFANGILALNKFQKASELLDKVITNLKQENEKYENLIQVLTSLATQYKKLDIQTKSHLRTVREQAKVNGRIVDEARQQLLKGEEFTSYIVDIEKRAQRSLKSSEGLRVKYDPVILGIKECCSKAKLGQERNELKADVAEKAGRIGLLGGMGVGGSFVAFQVATKALCVFGPPGAVAGGVLGLIGGGIIGAMAGNISFATVEALFRKYAEQFKILDETLSQVEQVLTDNYNVLTEICRLLGQLKEVANNLSECGQTDESKSKISFAAADNTNIDFLISLRFDELQNATKKLEENCQHLLDDVPLKSFAHMSQSMPAPLKRE